MSEPLEAWRNRHVDFPSISCQLGLWLIRFSCILGINRPKNINPLTVFETQNWKPKIYRHSHLARAHLKHLQSVHFRRRVTVRRPFVHRLTFAFPTPQVYSLLLVYRQSNLQKNEYAWKEPEKWCLCSSLMGVSYAAEDVALELWVMINAASVLYIRLPDVIRIDPCQSDRELQIESRPLRFF